MEQALGMRSSTRRPWTWVLRLLHARSLVPALLPGPWPSGADMADAVAALVDWLAEEVRAGLKGVHTHQTRGSDWRRRPVVACACPSSRFIASITALRPACDPACKLISASPQDRGFLPELAAEMHLQIALLQRAGLEQVEGQLAQVRTARRVCLPTCSSVPKGALLACIVDVVCGLWPGQTNIHVATGHSTHAICLPRGTDVRSGPLTPS